jgi:hypothetical protein
MPGLVPGIHVFSTLAVKDVDGRDKPGRDELSAIGPVQANRTGYNRFVKTLASTC